MIAYAVRYQTRRKGNVSMGPGDWQDKEMCVVAGENAIDAWFDITATLVGVDYRLTSISVDRHIDLVSRTSLRCQES
jgi:hypothetical protein